MSDDKIVLAPADPRFEPDPASVEKVVAFLKSQMPDADEVSFTEFGGVQLISAMENYSHCFCPHCRALQTKEWWHDWMDDNYGKNGFSLSERAMPCCERPARLDQLYYVFPQAFACCAFTVMNPGDALLPDGLVANIEAMIGSPVHTVFQHI